MPLLRPLLVRPERGASDSRHRAYGAFKALTSLVAHMRLTDQCEPTASWRTRQQVLRGVTGNADRYNDEQQFKPAIDEERTARHQDPCRAQKDWEWLAVAEQLIADGPAAPPCRSRVRNLLGRRPSRPS
jgi:hypothetical protein